MNKIKIGSVVLTGTPKIAAVVTEKITLRDIKKIKKEGADLVELRVDSITNSSPYEIIQLIKNIRKNRLPVICTIRKDVWEQKHGKNSEKIRLNYFRELIPYVDAVDIELEANEIAKKVISAARKAKKSVIFSCHNFKKMPDKNALKKIFNSFKKSGADILKIAGYAKDIDKAMQMMAFVKKISESVPIIGIAMGRAGEFSRIYGGLFGSCLTYGYTLKKVAPGQLSLKELKKRIKDIYY
jgi:3-dehydroquinate dehydratase-1